MIEDDTDEQNENIESLNFCHKFNIGKSKGILLCKYCDIMLDWIDSGGQNNKTGEQFLKKEMIKRKEVDLMEKILKW